MSRNKGADGREDIKDGMKPYESIFPAGSMKLQGKSVDRDGDRVKEMMEMTDIEHIAPLDKRWASSWNQSLLAT